MNDTPNGQPYGPHLTIDAYGCEKERLASLDVVFSFLDRMPEVIGMQKITKPYVFTHLADPDPEWGITGVVIIATSHVSFHSYPELGIAFVDVFSCKVFNTEEAIAFFDRCFNPKKPKQKWLKGEQVFRRRCRELAMGSGIRIEQKCETCGKPFLAKESEVRRGFGRFCCRSCARARPWNLGLTKETSPSVARISEAKKGDRNPSKREDFKEKHSLAMREKYRAGMAPWNKGKHGYHRERGFFSEERRRKSSEWMTRLNEKIASGEIPARRTSKTGWYTDRSGKQHFYESSYELLRMQQLDNLGAKWTKGHGIRIPYRTQEGKPRRYIPDFLVTYQKGDETITIIEEVKGYFSENDMVKARYARDWCRERGYLYSLIFGPQLKNPDQVLGFAGRVA